MIDNFTNLYTFRDNKDLKYGAPRLVPIKGGASTGSANLIGANSDSFKLYDVIQDFQWTTSPKNSRVDVPELFLKEKRLIASTYIAQAAYYTYALQGAGYDAKQFLEAFKQRFSPSTYELFNRTLGAFITSRFGGQQIAQVGEAVAGAIPGGQFAEGTVGAILNIAAGGTGALLGGNQVIENLNSIGGGLLGMLNNWPGVNLNVSSLNSQYLLPYEGLYLTEDTEFFYRFPYLVNNWNTVDNKFSNSPTVTSENIGGPAGSLYKFAETDLPNLAMTVTANVNINAPGIYIEKPKFYNFGDEGENIVLKFPLINTGWSTYYDVLRNWQLLFMLIYQNRPNRRSRDLIDPPVIYELTIPGIKYFPYAYIEQLKVSFLGSVRKMGIEVPYASGTQFIETIIPEAYDVTINLRTLVKESQNFLYSMLEDKYNIISTTNKRTLDEIQNLINPNGLNNGAIIPRQATDLFNRAGAPNTL